MSCERLAGLRQEGLELGGGRELLVLGGVEGLLDLGVGDLDAELVGLGLVPVGLDQEVHDLARERGEELLAVGPQRSVGGLGERRNLLADLLDALVKFGGSLGTITGCAGL